MENNFYLMSTIQIRIDEDTKKKARDTLDNLGLDMSSAIKLFLKQIILRKGIPFRILTENGLTPEEEETILKVAEEAKNGKNVTGPFNSAEELIKELKRN